MGHFYSLLLAGNAVHRILPRNAVRAFHYPFSCAFKCSNCLPKPSQAESLQSSSRADSDAVDIQRPRPCSSSFLTQRHDREEPDKPSSCDLLCEQVFLSHSGKQKNFARHLFKEMQRENISCFFDEDPQSLRMAEEFPPRIFEAAMNCKVAVVVLSEEFISTKWPMQELCAFVKAQNTHNKALKILPLFFAMSPDALAQKLQKKDFLKSWQKLQKSQRRSINFDEWIKALQALRRINGIKYIQSEGEVAYIGKVVAHIRDMLPPSLKYDESDVQGKERLCQEVAKLLEERPFAKNGVKIAGLYGVGGIGKTTIGKIACNFYSKHFNGRVLHMEFGREKSMKLLQRALKIFCGASESLVNSVMSIEQGWHLLQEMMYGKSVFLALDNISDLSECTEEVRMYLKAVCHGNRSMILLTSRSLSILKRFIPEESCMRVPSLQEEEAIAVLLKLTPLELSNLTIEQKDIARKCAQKCCFSLQYHPLVLQIFGAFLYDKFQYSWADLSRWIDIPNISWRDQMQEVFAIFTASFMRLSVQHRMIFMLWSLYSPHSYMTLEEALDWLAAVCSKEVGDIESAIIELKRKGFIESRKESRDGLYIHDLLIAFAESEADGTGKWIYLKGKDEIPPSLQEAPSNDRPRFSAMKFENCHFESPGMINHKLFTNVLVLHLEDMRTLKILDLSSMKIVRSIVIIGCTGLKEIHGLQSLTSLAYFHIYDCPADVLWPGIQRLRALRHLEVYLNPQKTTAGSLQGPWSSFPPLPDMNNLGTIRLEHLAKGPGPLHLIGCSKLQKVQLFHSDITLLDLTGCLELRTVDVRFCSSLGEIRLCNAGCLPPGPGCANFDSVPLERTGGFSGLPRLTTVQLIELGSLREVPGLDRSPHLSTIKLGGIRNLTELPSFSGLLPLTSIHAWEMGNLREFPNLSGLTRLTSLELWEMRSLTELPSLSGLPNLNGLVLGDMGSLRELPSLSGLSHLTGLAVRGMDSVREFPSLCGLPQLKLLALEEMGSLRELPSLSGLTNLSLLMLGEMDSLRELPDLCGLSRLHDLRLWRMGSLRKLPNLSGLTHLTSLLVREMKGLTVLPDLSGLPKLASLRLGRMDNLKELPTLGGLPCLTSLALEGMGSLTQLPNFSGLTDLVTLHLDDMHNITEVAGLDRLPNLRDLRVTNCGMIESAELTRCLRLEKAVTEECAP